MPGRVEIHRLPHSGRHFVARDDELRRLDRAWDDAHPGADAARPEPCQSFILRSIRNRPRRGGAVLSI